MMSSLYLTHEQMADSNPTIMLYKAIKRLLNTLYNAVIINHRGTVRWLFFRAISEAYK